MKHFLAISDLSPDEVQEILDLAVVLKQEHADKGNRPLFHGKVLGMIFQKPSLRTRVSFDMAMRHMDGDALYLSPSEIGLGQRESIADVARVLSGYVEALMARVFAHADIVELARWSGVPVINGLSDYNHPCQAMADALTIQERFGRGHHVKVAFVGDGNNVAVSLMQVCAKLGWDFTHSCPDGFDLDPAAVETAGDTARQTGAALEFVEDPHAAVREADVIYTDTWTSMGQEADAERRERAFPPYQVNAALVGEASEHVIVMHCLPAHRNHELTDEVADGAHSMIFQQAHNRLHAQKAILARLFAVA
jgi:ornithine carbamoyltransferase